MTIDKMKVVKGPHTVFIDVDNTLLFWPEDFDENDNRIKDKPTVLIEGREFVPNTKLIRTILKYRNTIKQSFVVWSSSGWEWAEKVVRALELEDYIDVVTAKPFLWFDDGPAHGILNDYNRRKP